MKPRGTPDYTDLIYLFTVLLICIIEFCCLDSLKFISYYRQDFHKIIVSLKLFYDQQYQKFQIH